MNLVPVQIDPQPMVAGNHQQPEIQLANQAHAIHQLERQVNGLVRVFLDGRRLLGELQQDNQALQGRVGQLELERNVFARRVAETENQNQELIQNMEHMQADNAQLAQRIRTIELEEDAKRVDLLRDEYINSGSSRLGGNLIMSTVVSPLFFGSTAWNAVALGLSAVNPATIPLLALGSVGAGTIMHESSRVSRQSNLEYYERECLNQNPNATKRDVFEYALGKIREKEEEEAKKREEEFRQEIAEEARRREQDPFADYSYECMPDTDF